MPDWKDIVSNVAPTLATALGGPLAGGAVKYLSSKFLGKDDASVSDLQDAILGATPEQLVKLREIDAQYKADMERAKVDIYALEVKDRDSARQLAKENMTPQIIGSVIFTIGYFYIFSLIINNSIKASGEVHLMIGVLTAVMTMIAQFWFGSSQGSKQKTKEITDKILIK